MTNFPRRTPAERLATNAHARRAAKSSEQEFVSGAIRHIILGGLAVLTGFAMIIVTIVVIVTNLSGPDGLPFETLYWWAVPAGLFILAAINVAFTIKRSAEKF